MNEFVKKICKELLRALLAGLLAALGLESVGCVACGDGAIATCVSQIAPNTKGLN